MNGGAYLQKLSSTHDPWTTSEDPCAKKGDYHCHQEKDLGVNKKARKKLIIACLLCSCFMVAEIIGGFLSNSLAITTDAAHLLTDLVGFSISLFSIQVAGRAPSKRMNYGWYRSEVLGAVTSVLMIWVVTAILVYMAILRILTKNYEIDVEVMLFTSGIGVIMNLIMIVTLQTGSSENINVRAAFIHVIGDIIQSVGVFTAALIVYFKRDWLVVDPICTFIFSIIVMITTITIMRDATLVLMEGAPYHVDYEDVLNTILSSDNVRKVHSLKIWTLSLDKSSITAHIVIDPTVDPRTVLAAVTKNLRAKFNFYNMTLQIEDFQPIMDNCEYCKYPY